MIIKGSGSKSGKGGQEDQNTLQNKAKLRFLGLISEGPVSGFLDADAGKDIFINNLPLKDSAGGLNYQGVSYTYRSGLPDQEHIPGFNSGSSLVSLGDTEVKTTTPYSFTVSGNYDAVTLTTALPALLDARADKGPKKTTLSFKIEVKTASGSFITAYNKTYQNEKTTSRYEEDFRVNLPSGGSPWTIRITKLTPDATPQDNDKLQNTVLAARYQPVVDGKFTYRNRAILAAEVDAEAFGSNSPTFKVKHKGIVCWVPKNYNPITRVYSTSGPGTSNGTWDGTFKSAWTNNPAWVIFDLITSNRYGLGDQFWKLKNPSQLINGPTDALVDKWQLYIISQYCDELVSNGYGGTEPRYTINVQIKDKKDAFSLLSSIVSTFRGMLYYAGGQVVFTSDKDEPASFEFTQANVTDGVFNYSSSSQKVLNSVAAVYWNDPEQFGRREIEIYEDYELISQIGQKTINVEAFGCTSRSLARRIAKWTLLTEKLQGEVISFSTGFEGASLFPGAIINVYDPYKSGVRAGGRLVSVTVSGGTTVFKVDSFTPVGASATITYIDNAGKPVTKNISSSNLANETYTVNEAINNTSGEGTIFALAWNTLKPQKYRVVSVSEDEQIYSVSAIKHDTGKYALIEQGISFPPIQTSLISSDKPPAPSSISIVKWFIPILGSESESRITVSWVMPNNGQSYNFELQVQTTTEPFTTVYQGSSNMWSSERLITTLDTEYKARVRTVDGYGRASLWRESDLFSLVGNSAIPPAPTNIEFNNVGLVSEISWVNPPVSDYKHTEVWVSTTANSLNAVKVTTISGDFYTYAHPDLTARYFWLKTVTNSLENNTSFFSTMITITPTAASSSPIDAQVNAAIAAAQTQADNARQKADDLISGALSAARANNVPFEGLTGNTVVSLSKPSVIVTSFANGSVPSWAEAVGQLTVTKDNLNVTGTATLAFSASAGLTGTINTATGTPVSGQPKGYYRVTGLTGTTGELTMTATLDGKTYTNVFPVRKVEVGFEIVSTLPITNLFEGRMAFLTTDDKLYRYTGTSWTAAIPTTDLTGEITSVQISNNAITAPKILAGSIGTSKLEALSITSELIAANAIKVGKVDAGAIGVNELAANSVVAGKINVTNLSSIKADLGTVTAGIAQNLAGTTFIDFTNGRQQFRKGSYDLRSGNLGIGVANWFGLSSVAIGSETKTNGVWALGDDGKIYYGSNELTTPTQMLTIIDSRMNLNLNGNTATFVNTALTKIDATEANSLISTKVDARFGTYTGNLSQALADRLTIATANANYASASDINTVSAKLGSSFTSVNTVSSALATLDGKVSSYYGVTLDGNGVTRFSLMNGTGLPYGGVAKLQADKFFIEGALILNGLNIGDLTRIANVTNPGDINIHVGSWTTVCQVTINKSSSDAMVLLVDASVVIDPPERAPFSCELRILRNGNENSPVYLATGLNRAILAASAWRENSTSIASPSFADSVGAGTYTYAVQVRTYNNMGICRQRHMRVQENIR
jgi:predicted phage tail protein